MRKLLDEIQAVIGKHEQKCIKCKAEHDRVYSELVEILAVTECIAEAPEPIEGEPLIQRRVKEMAHRLRILERENSDLRKMKGQ